MKDKPLVYLIQCPPNFIKTAPLGIEYLYQYLKNDCRLIVDDINIKVINKLNYSKHKWLSLDENFEINLFDKINKNYPQIIDDILKKAEKADLIGFSLLKRNSSFSFKLAEKISAIYPQKHIVFGGAETLSMKLHKKEFNPKYSWIIGEGELGLKEIIKNNKKQKIEFLQLDNLDSLNFNTFEKLDISLYDKNIPLFSSRGCIRKCKFCTECLLFNKFRQHSPKYIIEQIKLLIDKHDIKTFSFQDSLINGNLNWLENFCNLLIKENLKISWQAQIAVRNNFSLELAKLLKKSGCYSLFVGLESGSNSVLKKMNKGFNVSEAISFLNRLKNANLHYELSFITGFSNETDKEFKETFNFIKNNKILIKKIAQINPFINYFEERATPSKTGLQRSKLLVELAAEEKIPYTKAFINNLIY